MFSYLTRRLIDAALVLFAATLAAFALIHVAPGDPVTIALGQRATPKTEAILRKQLGLNKPLVVQYLLFLEHAPTLNFGDSLTYREPVTSILPIRVRTTALLTLYATLIAVLISVPLGILSALRRNRLADHSVRVVTLVTFCDASVLARSRPNPHLQSEAGDAPERRLRNRCRREFAKSDASGALPRPRDRPINASCSTRQRHRDDAIRLHSRSTSFEGFRHDGSCLSTSCATR